MFYVVKEEKKRVREEREPNLTLAIDKVTSQFRKLPFIN